MTPPPDRLVLDTALSRSERHLGRRRVVTLAEWSSSYGSVLPAHINPLRESTLGSPVSVRWNYSQVGEFRVLHSDVDGPIRHCYRTVEDIQKQRGEAVGMAMIYSGLLGFRQGGLETTVASSETLIFDLDEPFDFVATKDRSATLFVPHALLRQYGLTPRQLMGTKLDPATSTGRVASELLRLVLTDGHCLAQGRITGLITTALELIARDTLAGAARLQRGSRRVAETHLARIRAVVEAHLDDATATTAQIARECRLSVRQINRVLATQGHGLATYLRACRLDAAYLALKSPGVRHGDIAAIAYQHGFTNPAQFSRAFAQRFGATPRQIMLKREAPLSETLMRLIASDTGPDRSGRALLLP